VGSWAQVYILHLLVQKSTHIQPTPPDVVLFELEFILLSFKKRDESISDDKSFLGKQK